MDVHCARISCKIITLYTFKKRLSRKHLPGMSHKEKQNFIFLYRKLKLAAVKQNTPGIWIYFQQAVFHMFPRCVLPAGHSPEQGFHTGCQFTGMERLGH